jgi:DNA helicase HerA-like ATPase
MSLDLDVSGNVHRLIAAPTGAGKSYFVGALAETLYEADMPFMVLDTKTKNHIGLIGLKGVKRLQIRPGAVYDFEKITDQKALLCLPTLTTKTGDLIAQYTTLIESLYAAGWSGVIVVEEVHNYNKNPFTPSPVLELVSREGRGRGLSLWFVTQRIQDFPKLLWSQCFWTYLLKFNIPQDIKYISALIPNFDKINRDLNRYDVLEYNHISSNYRIVPAGEVKRLTKHYG